MKAIINANIVMPEYMIRNGVIVIDEGVIVDVGRKIPTEGMEVFDAKGLYVGPGLIDIHTHSDGNKFLYEDPASASQNLLQHGVTDVLPALYFNMKAEQLIEQINTIRTAVEEGKAPNIIGLYMEAPYMNPKFGCERENNPWKDAINKDKYMPLLEAAGTFAKVWCLAPEREGIEGFVKDALKINPNAVFSVAHSEATPQDIEPLMKYGLKLATHHTNATGTLEKYPECRGVCVDEAVWFNDDIYAEVICDRVGIHVDPYMLRLVRKIKGDDRMILIADAFVSDAPAPEGYEEAIDINFDYQGEIAGSKLTLDIACNNMMYHTGASVCQLFKFASTNPARMLGMYDRGSVEKGNLANLVVVDDQFNIQNVFLKGELVR